MDNSSRFFNCLAFPLTRSFWSLFDVLRFYADFFVNACRRLERLNQSVALSEEWRSRAQQELGLIKKECERISFGHLVEQTQRIIDLVVPTNPPLPSELDGANRQNVLVLLRELGNAIECTLKSCLFLRIHPDRASLYSEDDAPLFGYKVWTTFPMAQYEIAEAGRCFALERWDACVHHLMRGAEIAMRR